jgi:hypothetical protein
MRLTSPETACRPSRKGSVTNIQGSRPPAPQPDVPALVAPRRHGSRAETRSRLSLIGDRSRWLPVGTDPRRGQKGEARMTPPLLEADRAWFAALNAARRARTPRTRPRSSTRSRATSADRPKLVISFGEAHLALPRSCTGRDRAFSGTNHEAVTIRAAPRGGPRPQAGKAISATGAPGFSPHQVAHHNDNPSPRSQAERHRGPADDRGMPVDQLHGSPLSKSLPALSWPACQSERSLESVT